MFREQRHLGIKERNLRHNHLTNERKDLSDQVT